MRAAISLAAFGLFGAASGQVSRLPDNAVAEYSGYIIEYAKAGANFRGAPSLESEDVRVVHTFESAIFSGAAVEADNRTEVDLLALPQVARVWRNKLVFLEPSNNTETFSDDANSANYTSHHLTKVSGLHEAGIKGKGAKVAIVDTGIQYTHPALGGGYGRGFKIAGGHDFVGDGVYPDSGEPEPDDDPMDFQGHGTHVAGIVAGLSDRFSGVAPEATLYAYKVFSRSGATTEAILIEAFLAAYEDGVDIISASIGGTNGWQDNAWAVVASRLVDLGVVVTISAGNSGESGPFYGSSGSSGKNVIAVASTANSISPAPSFRVNFDQHCRRNTSFVGYIPTVMYFSSEIVGWPIVPVSLNTSATHDACEPLDEDVDFSDKIALVRRGGCTVATKQANLAAAGAYWILLYNNDQPLATFEPEDYQTILAVIEDFSGEAIVEAIAAGVKVTADFSATTEEIVGLPWAFGGRASYFTTWGGLNELQHKPDIAAPGGEIFSTYLDDRWSTQSGTSMAAPYVAGVAALYIGLNGGRDVHGPGFARDLSRRIISSGTNVKWWDLDVAGDPDAPPSQVGTGLIDASKIIGYTTSIDFDAFALNDTAHFEPVHNVTLRNGGDEAVTYQFSVQPAVGVETYYLNEGNYMSGRIRALYELEPVEMTVDVDLPESITLEPGESELVSFTFHKPAFEGFTLPLYSGKIVIQSSKNETLSVPYMGLGTDLQKEMSNMYMENSPEGIHVLGWQSIQENASWSNNIWGLEEDWLYTTVELRWPTRELRWDIFEAGWEESSWSYPPALGDEGYVGSVAYWRQSGWRYWSQFADDADPFDTTSFPLYDLSRHAIYGQYRNTFQWHGVLANGSQIEPGNYTLRLAALKPFGSPTEATDWSVWDIPEVSILGKFGPNPWNP